MNKTTPDSLDARLFSSVVLAVAPAVTMDEASSLSLSPRWKWQYVSLVEYDVLFVADLDVDLLPFELSPHAVRDPYI